MVNKFDEKVLSLVGNSADRPTTAGEGTTYMAIDEKKIYIFDGTNWVDITTIATYVV